MAEELSIVTQERDYSDIVQLLDPEVLGKSSLSYITEIVTGALATGKTGMLVAGGRLVQALQKGRLFQQFGKEFKKLREAGKIPEDFAEKKYGFQTWVELMSIIDEESPDADRLDALKAMFYEVNKINATDGERIAAYHLWQITRGLSSGEILLLKTAYEQRKTYAVINTDYNYWEHSMAESIGHRITKLIGLHEKRLTEMGLFSERFHGDLSGIRPENARLTDFGIKVCENIKNYQLVLDEVNSNSTPE